MIFYDDVTVFDQHLKTDAYLTNLKETEHIGGVINWEHNIKTTAFTNIHNAESLGLMDLTLNNRLEFYLPSQSGQNGFGYLEVKMPTSDTLELSLYNPSLDGLACNDVKAIWGNISLNSRTYNINYKDNDHSYSDFIGVFEDKSKDNIDYCSVSFKAKTPFKSGEDLFIFAGSTQEFEYISVGIQH